MKISTLEDKFKQLTEAVEVLKTALNCSYTAALSETLENITLQQVHVENGAPTPTLVADLTKRYATLNFSHIEKPIKRELLRLSIFKAQREDRVLANLAATPKNSALVLQLVLSVLVGASKQKLTVVDPVAGTGQLLLDVVNGLRLQQQQLVSAFGLDNDPSVLALAADSAALLNESVEFNHQDALDAWLTPQPELVVADLPIGYYPIDSKAASFDLKAVSGHSYAHYLLIEQSVNNLAHGGYGAFYLPNQCFRDTTFKNLLLWLTHKTNILCTLALPERWFSDVAQAKTLIVIQKHGEGIQAPQTTFAEPVPTLESQKDAVDFQQRLLAWCQSNK